MAGKLIYGIQQLGIGVADAAVAMKWYAQVLGMNIKVFDDNKAATYMAIWRIRTVLGLSLWKPAAFPLLKSSTGITTCRRKALKSRLQTGW